MLEIPGVSESTNLIVSVIVIVVLALLVLKFVGKVGKFLVIVFLILVVLYFISCSDRSIKTSENTETIKPTCDTFYVGKLKNLDFCFDIQRWERS